MHKENIVKQIKLDIEDAVAPAKIVLSEEQQKLYDQVVEQMALEQASKPDLKRLKILQDDLADSLLKCASENDETGS